MSNEEQKMHKVHVAMTTSNWVRQITGKWLCPVTLHNGPTLQTAPSVILKTFALHFQSPTGLHKLKVGAEIPGHNVKSKNESE